MNHIKSKLCEFHSMAYVYLCWLMLCVLYCVARAIDYCFQIVVTQMTSDNIGYTITLIATVQKRLFLKA